ncbi:hypothetical protein PENSPDRAFT_543247, partial [Peniophora sp. CONT]
KALLAWVTITHVCRRWRTIALEDPSLWTDIPFVLSMPWIDAFVSRSTALPIHLDW